MTDTTVSKNSKTTAKTFCIEDLEQLPSALAPLTDLPNWVVWRWTWEDAEWTKPPYRVDNPSKHAKNNDPSTWGSYEAACRAVQQGKADGIGFNLLGTDINALDLDKCRNSKTGAVDPWAQALIDQATPAGAYVEVTVSGTGFRILGVGSQKREQRKVKLPEHGPNAQIEFFRNCERFITISGLQQGNCSELPNIDALFDTTLAKYQRHKSNDGNGKYDEELFANVVDIAGNPFLDFAYELDPELKELVECGVPKGERSDKFHYVVCTLLERGWKCNEILAKLQRHPNGIAEKFRRRLKWAINYSFQRWSAKQDEAKDEAEPEPELEKRSLADVHNAFRKWLGDKYDLDAIDAVLAAAAAERLGGDPLWLLIISGPGAAKTETVQALSGAGAHVTSTIASEGALLSATSKKSRVKNATGGLLRKIGERGLLVIKDVTSILSSDRNIRGAVLAAIREIYDGRWERNVGTDGGQTLTWVGRIVIVGAVTTAWDSAHAVVAAMGDRFVSLRIDSNLGRVQSGNRSISNTGTETTMREELAAVVGGLIAHASTEETKLSDSEVEQLVKAADIVTMARTAVERDYRGDVAYGHAPEMPTRFAKQLTQMVRGGVAIGMSREQAMKLAIRCARDSIPPLRLEILLDIAMNPGSAVAEVRKRITKPWHTTKRELDALHMLGILVCEEETVEPEEEGGKAKTKWLYSLALDFDRKTLLAMVGIDKAAEAFLSA
jgi:hypothetical protein